MDGAPAVPAWPVAAVRQALAPLLPGLVVQVLPETASTNTELMERARAGLLAPVLLVAERQTAGRGRRGRSWESMPGRSLTFSLGLPLAPVDWSGLSLAVGVGLAESLHPRIGLKWPNDLWLEGRKLAGILIETAGCGPDQSASAGSATLRYAVIGAGLNIAAPGAAGLATAPAWLQELLPGIDAGQALLRLAAPLVRAVQAFERSGFAPFLSRFHDRDVLRGTAVALSDGEAGTARGVTATGALLVHTAGGMKTVTSAEVSVRPA